MDRQEARSLVRDLEAVLTEAGDIIGQLRGGNHTVSLRVYHGSDAAHVHGVTGEFGLDVTERVFPAEDPAEALGREIAAEQSEATQ